MQSKKSNRNQLNFLSPTLTEQLNSRQALYLLSHQIAWSYFEEAFGSLYSNVGRPAHSIRLMVSFRLVRELDRRITTSEKRSNISIVQTSTYTREVQ